jgi:predicted amidohydrolase YtcJ
VSDSSLAPDLVLINGRVHTEDDARPATRAEAIMAGQSVAMVTLTLVLIHG